jgi:hypothetical protein
MEIYLDEVEGNVIEKKKSRKKSRKQMKIPRIVIDSDSSSDDEITYQKRYIRKNKDSLDQFGIYLVSLLRQMPKEVSNRLQADFVKQIMTYHENKVVDGYSITIEKPSDVTVTSASNDIFDVRTAQES